MRFCERVSSMTYLLSSFFFFFLTCPQSSSHPASCAEVCPLCPSQTLARVVLQRLQSFHVHDLVCPFCILIERLSDTAFQMVDAEAGGSRDGDHVSEHEVVFGYHVLRQQTGELCRAGRNALVLDMWHHDRTTCMTVYNNSKLIKLL